jgi:hypothetical protein
VFGCVPAGVQPAFSAVLLAAAAAWGRQHALAWVQLHCCNIKQLFHVQHQGLHFSDGVGWQGPDTCLHLRCCCCSYCECFASGRYCDNCNCLSCFNNKESEAVRQSAVEAILERNPNAFRPKIQVGCRHGAAWCAAHGQLCGLDWNDRGV